MIQVQTELQVADNTGAKKIECIKVLVERKYQHPLFKKVVRSRKKYSAHDETNKYKSGDKVSIIECKPYSKSKKFEVIEGKKWFRFKQN